mmetsp:Transcript_7947/g.11695  ORF Transcript_7947/g.11695 Transcript_7947/m.11695 type:complete len:351 (+) Transcript_7947:577-1629(+)
MEPCLGNDTHTNIKFGHINLYRRRSRLLLLLLLFLLLLLLLLGVFGHGTIGLTSNITIQKRRKTLIVKGRKLLQKANIILIKFPNIIDIMDDHCKPFRTKSCSESRYLIRIKAGHFDHIRVDHTAPEHLEPLPTEENVDFHTRLGEREVRSTESDLDLWSEHFLEEVFDGPLEMTHVKLALFVQCEDFNLMEDHTVGGINVVLAVDTSRCDDAEGWLTFGELTNLYGGGMRAEERAHVFREVECILHIARWVVLGTIERLEAIIIRFNFWTILAFGDSIITQGDEDIDGLFHGHGEWMASTDGAGFGETGHGDVNLFALHLFLNFDHFHFFLTGCDEGFELIFDFVDDCA